MLEAALATDAFTFIVGGCAGELMTTAAVLAVITKGSSPQSMAIAAAEVNIVVELIGLIAYCMTRVPKRRKKYES